MRGVIRAGRRRVTQSGPGRTLEYALIRRTARSLHPGDPALAAVTRSMTTTAGEEAHWVARIERCRKRLEASSGTIPIEISDPDWWQDHIARSRDPNPPVLISRTRVDRHLAEITRVASRPRPWGMLFYRLIREVRPTRCLELGTNVGMSGAYIGGGLAANGAGRLVSIEGQQARATVARSVFEEIDLLQYVDVRVGRFADLLPEILSELAPLELAFIDGHHLYEPTMQYFDAIAEASAPGSLLIFDDVVYWRAEMAAAWDAIKADRRVTASLTVGTVGFAVVNGVPAGHDRLARLPIA